MTKDLFNVLNENEKVELIFDAKMITETFDDEARYQLFQIDNFYIETKTSLRGKFRREITCYSLADLPVDYAGEVTGIPFVLSEKRNTTPVINYTSPEVTNAVKSVAS